MNRLSGTISDIETDDRLSIVQVKLDRDLSLQVIVIESPDTSDQLCIGAPAKVLFKETEVHLAMGFETDKLSLQNALPGTLSGLEQGKLLTRAKLTTPAGSLSALIPTRAAQAMQLKPGMKLIALVSFSEIMLAEV